MDLLPVGVRESSRQWGSSLTLSHPITLSVLNDLGISFRPPPPLPSHTSAAASQMFPRHILEHMMAAAEKEPGETPASVDHLAHSHQNVTIMFMDIVGECMGAGRAGRCGRDCVGREGIHGGGVGGQVGGIVAAGRVHMGRGGLTMLKVHSAITSFVDTTVCVRESHAHTGSGCVGLK